MNDAGRSATIDWPQIRQVRLYCNAVDAPTPLFSRLTIPTFRYFCEITLHDKKRLVIVSGFLDAQRHWVGMGPPYRAFVEHLHDRLRANRSRARFRRGLTCYGFFNYFFGTFWPRLGSIISPGFFRISATEWPVAVLHFPGRYRPQRLPQNLLPPF